MIDIGKDQLGPVQNIGETKPSPVVSVPNSQADLTRAAQASALRELLETSESEKPRTFDVITKEQIEEYKNRLQEWYAINLSGVSVDITRPGDDLFDKEEIKFRYFQHAEDSRFEDLGLLIEEYEEGKNVPIDQIRLVAAQKGIVLEGRMPGFAATPNKNQIIFFSVQERDAVVMAQNYAAKEGERGRVFATTEEAKNYLKGLGEKAFLHEVGHVVYAGRRTEMIAQWTVFVDNNEKLKDRVANLQKDKYEGMEESIPVAEEAFADFFVNVVGEGKVTSRLDHDEEAIQRVERMLIPEQQNNTAAPGEVSSNLQKLRDQLNASRPFSFESVQDKNNARASIDEHGEIIDKN